ncbi:MAG: PilN domain-containing protein [Gammaproteobacteria bacterium]
MTDIDLIPTDYRRSLWLRHKLFIFAALCGGIVALTTAAHLSLGHWVSGVKADIGVLQVQQKIATQQREELTRREAKKKSYEYQLVLLEGLRSGAAAEKMFITIDRALRDNEVWFLNWEFKRAGEVVTEGPSTVNTGYFIVVPAGAGRKKAETWRIDTHMTIRGEALDHAALSRFVRRLIDQPEIQDARVIRTATRTQAETRVVNFEMAVIVHSGAVTG